MMHIIIVEDEENIRRELKQLLQNAMYEVTTIEDFSDVAGQVLGMNPWADLVLLDLNLPEESGFYICTKIREQGEIPVIFLTSRTDSMDELNGILKGADDYITKPFNAPILLARIANVLKRTAKKHSGEIKKDLLQLEHKGVVLNLSAGTIEHGGKKEELTKNELKILHYLFRKPGEIVPRVEIIEYLWDNEAFIDDNTLSVNMTRIRGKLMEIGAEDFIETRRGMGYRI